MTDRELLEAAAKAAAILLLWLPPGSKSPRSWNATDESDYRLWNPLTDDGDALRLAVKLGMEVYIDNHPSGCECSEAQSHTHKTPENQARSCINHEGDQYAATRRAIVRAAAALCPSS
jgi:hypothetical protein